jgi:hypothetical protein
MTDLVTRVRGEIGDRLQPFRDTLRGTGDVLQYELSAQNISTTGLSVVSLTGTTQTTLATPADYTLDDLNGIIDLTVPLPVDVLLLVAGNSYGLFSDEELTQKVTDALAQHTKGRTVSTRYQDANGFIRYDERQVTVANLPAEEELLVALLASIEAMWTLSTDAATDINVQTSDGTTVDRGQRFAQLQTQIAATTDRYAMLCQKLGVGLFTIEVTNLRRVSRTTNRLVPLYREREFDDYSLPQRILPPIGPGHQNDDESGIPTQTINGYW